MKKAVHLLFGPPANQSDENCLLSLFFSAKGKHIVCGGATAKMAADYLGKELKPSLTYESPEIPPIGEIEGVDLVTEGIFTMQKVFQYAKDLGANDLWQNRFDGASRIFKLLMEADEIYFYVGKAVNPAHVGNFYSKPELIKELSGNLRKTVKPIVIQCF